MFHGCTNIRGKCYRTGVCNLGWCGGRCIEIADTEVMSGLKGMSKWGAPGSDETRAQMGNAVGEIGDSCTKMLLKKCMETN